MKEEEEDRRLDNWSRQYLRPKRIQQPSRHHLHCTRNSHLSFRLVVLSPLILLYLYAPSPSVSPPFQTAHRLFPHPPSDLIPFTPSISRNTTLQPLEPGMRTNPTPYSPCSPYPSILPTSCHCPCFTFRLSPSAFHVQVWIKKAKARILLDYHYNSRHPMNSVIG